MFGIVKTYCDGVVKGGTDWFRQVVYSASDLAAYSLDNLDGEALTARRVGLIRWQTRAVHLSCLLVVMCTSRCLMPRVGDAHGRYKDGSGSIDFQHVVRSDIHYGTECGVQLRSHRLPPFVCSVKAALCCFIILPGAVLNSVEVKTAQALGKIDVGSPFGPPTQQFLRQLEASATRGNRKTVYGCLTSGSRWVFAKFTLGGSKNRVDYAVHDFPAKPRDGDARSLLNVLIHFGTRIRTYPNPAPPLLDEYPSTSQL